MKNFRVSICAISSVDDDGDVPVQAAMTSNGGGPDNANDKSYLSIRINNVGSVAGYAAGDYSDGTAGENHIESVRSLFLQF